MREQSGADLILRLTGREAQVMIDPTMILSAQRWRMIASPSPAREGGQRYVLTYFLGRQEPETREQIRAIANKEGLRVLNLNTPEEETLFRQIPANFWIWLITWN